MKKRTIKWRIILPVIAVLLVTTVAFIGIGYFAYREHEIEDLENYARGADRPDRRHR